ncbi:MAG: acetyl-CoA carboxylase biotin carboxyl carrier protein [Bdellovibrionales bacterium]|nr:acetyl-CoA carboxylase biotin carboxyl carrier protein [Bdellovibrionales bacterium]
MISTYKAEMDIKRIKELFKVVEKTDFQEIEIVEGEFRLRIERNKQQVSQVMTMPAAPVMASNPTLLQTAVPADKQAATQAPKKGNVITSPFVGTFYRSPSPDTDPYIEVGQTVKEGQILCIVEAMKLMNEIESDFSGVVKEIFVENGQPVEFGQELFRIE